MINPPICLMRTMTFSTVATVAAVNRLNLLKIFYLLVRYS
jgi:hypothetical protein